jgi:hypothetical protein
MNSSFGIDVKSGFHTSNRVVRMLSWSEALAFIMLVSFLNALVDSNAMWLSHTKGKEGQK